MKLLINVIAQLFLFNVCYSQQLDSNLVAIVNLPGNYHSKVDKKLSSLDEKLTQKSIKYLKKLEKHETRLLNKLNKLNPGSADKLLASTKEKYCQFSEKIKSKAAIAGKISGGQYNSYLDTLSTSLAFLKQFNNAYEKVKQPLQHLQQLQSKLQQTEKIQQFVAERKQRIKEQLLQFTKLPKGLKKEYEKLSKTAYYYSAQVKEYKEMLRDPAKLERKAISLLQKLPLFQKFLKENSQLASMFRLPSEQSNGQSLAGLQTRESVQNSSNRL